MVETMHQSPVETENDREAAYFKLEALGYRGVYVLTDNNFRWFTRMSADGDATETSRAAFAVGERTSNKESLIDALLNANAATPLAGDYFEPESPKPIRISFGETKPEDAPAESATVTPPVASSDVVRVPVDWLNSYRVEIASCPTDERGSSEVDDALYSSDLLVFVTDAIRPISTPGEVRFVERFFARGKRNLVVAVNNVDHLEGTPANLERLTTFIQRKLADIRANAAPSTEETSTEASVAIPAIPVFPISSKKARALQVSFAEKGRRTDVPEFTTHWTATGVQDLKSTILSQVSSDVRSDYRVESAKFVAAEALRRVIADQDASLEMLASTKSRIQNVLVPGLVSGEERLYTDFEKRELQTINDNLGQLVGLLRSYFDTFGVFKLLFRSDILAAETKATMRTNSLLKAEYEMTYSVGKLNEGLYTLYDRTRAELETIASEAHPLSAYKLSKGFQSDVKRILAIIDKQSPPNGVLVDPFKLRNLIATFDETNQADKLQESAERLVRRHLAIQLVIVSGGVFSTYLGVPWSISIPSTLFTCGLGVGLMHLNWKLVQDHFISRISEAQKKLQSKLLSTYDEDFRKVVAEPLAAVVKLLEDSLESRIKEGQAAKAKVKEVLALIEGDEPTAEKK
ncbi:hypothetical protein HDU96_006212 [Phlyctochytrium bullatum]|nr:hypothetical protein HDU96_006212 [Phlyctochytrium bullatum]